MPQPNATPSQRLGFRLHAIKRDYGPLKQRLDMLKTQYAKDESDLNKYRIEIRLQEEAAERARSSNNTRDYEHRVGVIDGMNRLKERSIREWGLLGTRIQNVAAKIREMEREIDEVEKRIREYG